MSLVKFHSNLPQAAMEPGEPLYKYVPTKDAEGRSLADFMMLIPKLKTRPQHEINDTLNNLQTALEKYDDVVFVNINLKINVLWVSINAKPGLIFKIVASIHELVPEALLVTHY